MPDTVDTLLVPLDFSACAPLVLAEAVRFARAFGARLLLLHVCEPPRGLGWDARVQPAGAREPLTVRDWLFHDAESRLGALARVARDAGIEVEARVEAGRVSDVVLEVADRDAVRLIVMGTHGRTGFARVTLGSIAEEVVRHASVPVVTLRTLHRPDCAAPDCARCAADRTPVDRALTAEREG